MTRAVRVGARQIGGGRPVTVQSMLNTPSADAGACVAQARTLEAAGCEICALPCPTRRRCAPSRPSRPPSACPLGRHPLRLPARAGERGGRGGQDPDQPGQYRRRGACARRCGGLRKAGVPIRVGVNSGSVDKAILARHGRPCAEALAESAVYSASLLEKYGFTDIVLSVKASDVTEMIRANRILHNMSGYPLHLGVTEAGTAESGLIKSSIGIGSLLCDGIGDTIRVSLTADPVQEVYAAKKILRFCGLRREGWRSSPAHLRQDQGGLNRARTAGGAGRGLRAGADYSCDHGLRGQRAGRSARGGHRPCGRRRRAASVQAGPAVKKGPGVGCGGYPAAGDREPGGRRGERIRKMTDAIRASVICICGRGVKYGQ